MSFITSSIELSRILTNSQQLKDNDIGDFNEYKNRLTIFHNKNE